MKRVSRVFADWSNEHEQRWLAHMEAKGCRFIDRSTCTYRFAECHPTPDTAYRMDFRVGSQRDLDEYFDLAADAGWCHVHTHNGWHYFRRRSDANACPEFFTDDKSVKAKYRRAVLAALAVWIPWALIMLPRLNTPITSQSDALRLIYMAGRYVAVAVAAGMAYWLFRMAMLMR